MDTELIKTIYGEFYGFQGELITKRLKQLGAYERNDLAMVMSFLKEGDTVLDVGGNIGTFAIPVALKVGGTGKVYTFEGNPQTYSVLSQNIAINNLENQIQAIQAIVTSISGNYVLMDPDDGIGSATCYFQLVEQQSHKLSDSQELPCIALDDWWKTVNQPQISLIKVDVEGADLNVLNSAREIIKRDKPIIFVEINAKALSRYGHSAKDVEDFLLSFGYHLFRNIGLKNSGTDEYTMGRLSNLSQGFLYKEGHYNALAVHPQSDRYSLNYKGSLYTRLYLLFKQVKGFIRNIIKK